MFLAGPHLFKTIQSWTFNYFFLVYTQNISNVLVKHNPRRLRIHLKFDGLGRYGPKSVE